MRILVAMLCAILLAVGCGGNTLPPAPRPTDRNAKPTVAMREYTSHVQWQQSGYFRVGDELIDLPVFLAIAADGTACIVSGAQWALWHTHTVVACAERWRRARP